MMRLMFHIQEEGQPPRKVEILHGLKIGREKEKNDVALKDPTVSRNHCVVELRKGQFFIRDLGSKKSTRILEAGTELKVLEKDQYFQLRPGLTVVVGNTLLGVEVSKGEAVVGQDLITAVTLEPRDSKHPSNQRVSSSTPSLPTGAREQESYDPFQGPVAQAESSAPPIPASTSQEGQAPPPPPKQPFTSTRRSSSRRLVAVSVDKISAPVPPEMKDPSTSNLRSAPDSGEIQRTEVLDGVAYLEALRGAQPRLVVSGYGILETFDIDTTHWKIGRSKEVHLSLNIRSLSERHASIHFNGSSFFIQDLGSTNQTFLQRISDESEKPLSPNLPEKLPDDSGLRFGDLTAYFYLGRPERHAIRAALHDRALKILERAGTISAADRKSLLQRDGSVHPGEELIKNRKLRITEWLAALRQAGRKKTPAWSFKWTALILGGAVLLALLGWLLTR